jgi:hypothetical protein
VNSGEKNVDFIHIIIDFYCIICQAKVHELEAMNKQLIEEKQIQAEKCDNLEKELREKDDNLKKVKIRKKATHQN